MEIKGVVADVAAGAGATWALSAIKGTGVGWGVSIIGGAVGGAVGQWVADGGISWEGTVKGGFAGAVGGLLGWGAGKAVGKAIGKWSDNATKKVDDLTHPDELKTAEKAASNADQALKRAERELQRHRNSSPPAGKNGKVSPAAQQKYNEKLAELEKNVDELRDTHKNFADDADELRKKTASSDDLKKAEASKKRAEWWKNSKIPAISLVALGSALAREGYNGYNGSGGGPDSRKGGAAVPPAEQTVALKWSGLAAANSAGVFGKPPFVPDPSIQAEGTGFLAHPVELDRTIATWYGGPANSLASSLAENYKMFGELEKRKDPEITPIRTLSASPQLSSTSKGGEGYAQNLRNLNTTAEALNKSQAELIELRETEDRAEEKARAEQGNSSTLDSRVTKIVTAGKQQCENLITGINAAVSSIPADDINGSFLGLLNQALAESMGIIQDAAAALELEARTVGNPNLNPNPSDTNLADSVNRFDSGVQHPELYPDTSKITSPADLDILTPDDIKADAGKNSELDKAIDHLQQASAPISTNPGALGGAADPAANMMGSLMNSMLPMMMQQMMMRNMADNDMAGRRADIDPARYERERAATAPAAVPPVGTTPWSTQPAAATPPPAAQQAQTQPHSQTGPSSGATSSQAGGRPPRVPGEDGSVVYTFPDGRTQKVSPTVAKVLDKAFANIKGTDAQEAYAETEAKWTDRKEIGTRVDPFQLMTGDIATWDDRTAVLVVFGSAEEGTLEVIVNGEITTFEPEMSDSAGEFGQFSGFMHPPGIELGASKDTGVDGAPTANGDSPNSAQPGDAALVTVPA